MFPRAEPLVRRTVRFRPVGVNFSEIMVNRWSIATIRPHINLLFF